MFDLWDRRFSKFGHLIGFAVVGAGVGLGIQRILAATGHLDAVVNLFVQPMGDLTLLDPATGAPKFAREELLTNWPAIFGQISAHLGWIFGAVAGLALYFYRYGAWRSGSALLIRMAVWSMLCSWRDRCCCPTCPSSSMSAGSDSNRLAAIAGPTSVGCMIGLLLYCRKAGLKPVSFVTWLSGAFGGLALTTAQFIKVLCISPGNPDLTDNPAVIAAWQHWRSANWHSIALEQFAGVLYGLAILIPIGILASRLPVRRDEPRVRPWTEIYAVVFIFNILTYINVVKNLEDWTAARKIAVTGGVGIFRSVAEMLKAPLFGSIELSAWSWFTLMWIAFTACTILVLVRHRRHPVALIPSTWLGKGQLLYLMFLWLMVIANFAKALVAFHESRIATEGTIMFNALICTVLHPRLGAPAGRSPRDSRGQLWPVHPQGARADSRAAVLDHHLLHHRRPRHLWQQTDRLGRRQPAPWAGRRLAD